jgi:hypothetical protein
MLTLRVEFARQDHPIGQAIAEVLDRLTADCADRISAARQTGAMPGGPPSRETADAYLGVVEAVAIALSGHAPYDTELAERAVRGVLGLPPGPLPDPSITH